MIMSNDNVNWSKLPADLLNCIVHRLSCHEDYVRYNAVCKSWSNSVSEFNKPFLPPRNPLLFLAEEVAPGAILRDLDYYGDSTTSADEEEEEEEEEEDSGDDDDEEEDNGDDDEDIGDDDEEEDNGDDDEEDSSDDKDQEDSSDDEDKEKKHNVEDDTFDHIKNSVGSGRGLYSLLTRKTYNIDLPEAAGRLILGANKGWLVTLGRDLQINLLHPLLKQQISLPPMLTFPRQYLYDEHYDGHIQPEEASDMFIHKVAISSKILNKSTVFGLHHHHASPSPTVMAIYGEFRFLGFSRFGDKVWTDVNVPSRIFNDIVYHKGNFYAVNNHGDIFVCGTNDNEGGGDIRGTKIASLESNDWEQKYLVELSSGSGLLLIVRYCKEKRLKYRTTDFSVWRLDLKYSPSIENISCVLKQENDLGNEAIFIGKASSAAVSSSEIIKPNCIYFTDDNWVSYYRIGGGHDMGIYSMEHHTIEPHFEGKSIHPISPPLWYI